jgi:ABC-type branched-subunit amino acid transport system ATPase component
MAQAAARIARAGSSGAVTRAFPAEGTGVLAKGRVVAAGSSAELRRASEVNEAYFG